jgi:hypothetical protein
MRYLKKLCATGVLTLALALSAFAGEMSAGFTAPPPPPPQATAQGEMSAGITGDMPTGITGDMGAGGRVADPTGGLLGLLQSLLAFF